MKKIFVQMIAIAVVCAGLSVFWHAMAMRMPMDSHGDMSATCLTVCIGETAQASPWVALAVQTAAIALLTVLLLVFLPTPPSFTIFGIARKDRHRYLMKNMVMPQ